MSISLSGKTAIVTGAANGIGLAIARHFVDKGANVMFADIDEDKLASELGAPTDEGPIRFYSGDLCKKLTMANLVSATIAAFDRVDILVNASRQIQRSDLLKPEDDEIIDIMLRQNLLTSLRLSQLVARRMIAQAEKDGNQDGPVGSIVNISNIAAQRSRPELLAYSISCAALDQATRSLALALAPHRIRVNAVAFGSVMSASLQSALRAQPDWHGAVEQTTPMGRIAPASDLTDAVQFLASDGAAFVTGQILTVDGGRGLVDPVPVPAH